MEGKAYGSLSQVGVKAWGEEWKGVLAFAAALTGTGFLFGLESWSFGIIAAMLVSAFDRLAVSAGRTVLFMLSGALAVTLAFSLSPLWTCLAAGAAAFLWGVLEETGGTERLGATAAAAGRPVYPKLALRGLHELPLGLFAGWIFPSLLIREHHWAYQPVQLAAFIFCVLLLILSRNRLLSLTLSLGLVLLADLRMPG